MQKLGVAIIGTGFIANVHADIFSTLKDENVELKAVYSRTFEKGEAFGKKYCVDVFTDYERLLARDDIHIVDVCTPSGTHADFAVPAARAGKHLIIEKPLEVTVDRCLSIIEAAESHGVFVAVIFQNRFKDAVQKIRTVLERGAFGQLVLGDAHIKWYRSPEYYQGWKGTKQFDGGAALINQGIHTIDLLQWMMGPVEEVFGYTATKVHRIEGEDVGVAVLRFRSGALGVIEASTAAYPGLPERLGIYGSGGFIEMEGSKIISWNFFNKQFQEEINVFTKELEVYANVSGGSSPSGIGTEFHRRQILAILRAIRSGEQPPISPKEATKSVAIIEGIYKANLTGKSVRLPSWLFES